MVELNGAAGYFVMALIVGILLLIPVVVWGIVSVYKDLSHYNKVLKPQRIEDGYNLLPFMDILKVSKNWRSGNAILEYQQYWVVFIGIGVAACAWPLSVPVLILYALYRVVAKVCGSVSKTFFSDEVTVLRYLKENPSSVEKILEDSRHKYFAIADRLNKSGVIVIEKSTQMIKIDDKEYVLQVK